MDASVYMTNGREFFDAVRSAAQDIAHLERVILRMESAEGARGGGWTASRGGPAPSDGMRATDARLDYEARVSKRLDDDYALVDLGAAVIYGRDQMGGGGLCRLMGGKAADACWWRFGAGETWAKCAEMVGASERWCRAACERACDTVDALGFAQVMDGRGMAED